MINLIFDMLFVFSDDYSGSQYGSDGGLPSYMDLSGIGSRCVEHASKPSDYRCMYGLSEGIET